MSFLKSVLYGNEGSYKVFGFPVKFEKEQPTTFPTLNLDCGGFISNMAVKCQNSKIIRWVTQGYAHVLVHEMCHAVACRLFVEQNAHIYIYQSRCLGLTVLPPASAGLSEWKKTIISLAGPCGDIAFSSCKLIAAAALKNYLSWPVAVVLGGSGIYWISGEFFYAYTSASHKDAGDFGSIAKQGKIYLALASTALVSQCALGVFTALTIAIKK